MQAINVTVFNRWFFGAFFGALYWARLHTLPALGSLENAVLWPDFKAVWPSAGGGYTGSPAGIVEPFATIGPWPLPTRYIVSSASCSAPPTAAASRSSPRTWTSTAAS